MQFFFCVPLCSLTCSVTFYVHLSIGISYFIFLSMTIIVQYVIVRGDLIRTLDWPLGAVIAQACHASTAVTHLFYDDPITQTYLSDLDNMHKVVLESPDEKSLKAIHDTLEENNIKHKLWIEQPENILTCLAVKPYPKEQIHKYLKKFKLYKK